MAQGIILWTPAALGRGTLLNETADVATSGEARHRAESARGLGFRTRGFGLQHYLMPYCHALATVAKDIEASSRDRCAHPRCDLE